MVAKMLKLLKININKLSTKPTKEKGKKKRRWAFIKKLLHLSFVD
jgi:hypothetical protein